MQLRTRSTPRQLGSFCCSQLIRGYVAILIYTSSCSRTVYESVIRPEHVPAITAASAATGQPSYHPIRDLFRGRRSPLLNSPESNELLDAIKLYQTVRAGVAAKLVPQGKSLLQDSATKHRPQNMRLRNLSTHNSFWRCVAR